MKIEVSGNDFKKAVDRVACLVNSKSMVEVFRTVLLEARRGVISLTATNLEQYVQITLSGVIVEDGYCFISLVNLKKVYTMADTITISLSSDGKEITFKNSKKKSMIFASDVEYGDMTFEKSGKLTDIIEMKEGELVSSLTELEQFVKHGDVNPVMQSINIDLKNGRMVALDGHRLTCKKINGKILAADGEYNVPGIAYYHMKKISNSKRNTVTIKSSDKIMEIHGEDYVYKTKLISGQYFDVDGILGIGDDKPYSFKVEADELAAIAKEYSKIDKETSFPMVLMMKDGEMKTYINTYTFKTSDTLRYIEDEDGSVDEKNFLFPVSPQYLYEALALFGSENVMFKGNLRRSTNGSIITPIVIYNNEYTCLVLPVNMSQEHVIKAREFVL